MKTCPIKDKAWDELVRLVGGNDEAYKVYAWYGERVPSYDELVRDGMYNPDKLQPRSYEFVLNIERKLDDLAERIKLTSNKLKKKDISMEDKMNAMSEMERLVEERRSLGGIRKRAMKEATLDRLLSLGYVEKRKCENLLNRKYASLEDMISIIKTADYWIAAGGETINEDHILFTPQDLKDLSEGNEYMLKAKDKLNKLINGQYFERKDGRKVNLMGFEDVREAAIKNVIEFVKSNPEIKKYVGDNADWSAMIDDNNWWQSRTQALEFASNHPIIKAITGIMNEANIGAKQETHVNRDDITQTFEEKYKAHIKRFNDLMVGRWKDGKRHGGTTARYYQDYFDRTRAIRKKLNDRLREINSNEKFTVDEQKQMDAEAYAQYFDELKKEDILIDIRYIFGEKVLQSVLPSYQHTITDEQQNKYKKMLVDKLGLRGYEKVIEATREKVNRAIDERGSYRFQQENDLKANGVANVTEELDKKMAWWDATNNPLMRTDYWHSGFKPHKVNDLWVNAPNFSYIETIAKDDADYNKNFQIIEGDENLNALYDFYVSKTQSWLPLLPQSQVGMFQSNRIALLPKGVLTNLIQSGMTSAISTWWNDSMTSVMQKDIDKITNDALKDPNGKDVMKIQAGLKVSFEEQLNTELEILISEYKIKNGVLPDDKTITEWKHEISDKLANEYEFDIEASLLALNMAATSYKHKSTVEPTLRALKMLFDRAAEAERNMAGVTDKKKYGKIKVKDRSLKHMTEQFDYNWRMWHGYPTKKETRLGKKKIYSAKEKKLIEKYEGIIDGLEKLHKDGKIEKDELAQKKGYWLRKIDGLGSYAIVEKIARKPMTFFHMTTFALNPLTAIGNFGQGLFDNYTEAAGRMYFNPNDMHWAYGRVLQTQLAPFTDDAKKIFNIMKKLCVYETRRDELTPSGRAGLKKWQELLDKYASPYALTQNVEFMNQTATVMAILKHDGLWDKFDKDGNAKDVNTVDLAAKCDALIIYIHGDYKKPLMYDKNILMQMFMTFKRWIPMAINRRVGKEHFDFLLRQDGAAFKGRWRSYGDFIKTFGDGPASYGMALVEIGKQLARKLLWQGTSFEKVDGLKEIDIANMRKNMNEIMWLLAANAMLIILRGMMADDDDEETKAVCAFWLNRLVMMENDIMFMANPNFWSNANKNAIPIFRMYNNVGKVFGDLANVATGGEDEYTTGEHAGESKLLRDVLKITPYASAVLKWNDAFLDQQNGGVIETVQENLSE